MGAVAISLVAFACIFGGTLVGMFVSNILPEHHMSDESKDAVKMGIGMVATMAALVLALLIASAKGNFDTLSSGLRQTSSRVILLDRVMSQYGPETKEARELLRRSIASTIKRVWPEDRSGQAIAEAPGSIPMEAIQDQLHQLAPRNNAQRWLQSRALQISGDIAEGRWLIIEQLGQSSVPMPFLVMLVFWLTAIFAGFGLFSPRNAMVITVLLVCTLSAAGALFLILELDTPYAGLLKVSSAPLRIALAHLGQ
jgi:hypothetical protein